MNKKGQTQSPAAGAAILIAIIAGVVILFVMFLPPGEREELLGDDSKKIIDDDVVPGNVRKALLREKPGRIDYLATEVIEHPLPVINVYTRTESRVLAEKQGIYAKKGIFSEQTGEFTFVLNDLEHTGDVLFNLKVSEGDGNSIIFLNGEEVYNAKAEAGESKTIPLPRHLLSENNQLTFAVSSPGLAFWRTNQLALESVKVVADVTSIEAQSSSTIFLISETEKRNLERVTLRFEPACTYEEVSKLFITINGRQVYNAVPDCDVAFVPIEFSSELVKQGENEIVFSATKGAYQLSHVMILSKLKEIEFPTFYFDVSLEEFTAIQEGDLRLRLSIDFVDVVTQKVGDLVFNGHIARFDTKEVSYVVDISEDVVRGNNALKIKPRKTLEVRQLRVDLVE